MCVHYDQPDGVPPLPERYRVRRSSNSGGLGRAFRNNIAPTEDIWKGRPMPQYYSISETAIFSSKMKMGWSCSIFPMLK